ncbi:alpha/beta-hydrolase [Polyporus arcularius HHB13444]|uniref:Alpha/beta-hydrolase n=1 Tax=Polyporus arcularius HHB13444 TaxID=1314778 RepID=A0A5C3PUM3_9APHY|nr:alpha/beta-hydrolase [Polyporus arcularius HHB13444]
MASSDERPYSISIPHSELDFLKKKLELTRFPDELEGAAWNYGAPLSDIKRLVGHWQDGYDWRKSEAALNKLPMFTRDIEVEGFGTLNIHYVHQKSDVAGAIPLLFAHGWPGSFLEVRKLLPLLSAGGPDHPSFHVVAPSLPGFGFSEGPSKPGFKGPQYAEVLNKLMLALGYEEYVYQGGDWGYALGKYVVTNYGHRHVKAWHTNMPLPGAPSLFKNPLLYLGMFFLSYDETSMKRLANMKRHRTKGTGYFIEQATKPQTIGYSLADSPVGLLSWIYEKLVSWTDEYPWTDDEVIEWISVYWLSRAGPAASTRIYHELTGGMTHDTDQGTVWTSVPLGVSYFPKEIFQLPKSWSHTLGNLVFESDHDKGGHFAAFEQPEAIAGDLRKMFGKGGPAHGVVPGKGGY